MEVWEQGCKNSLAQLVMRHKHSTCLLHLNNCLLRDWFLAADSCSRRSRNWDWNWGKMERSEYWYFVRKSWMYEMTSGMWDEEWFWIDDLTSFRERMESSEVEGVSIKCFIF